MAGSKVDVANAGLILLGPKTISSFDDNTTLSNLVKARFDDILRETLRAHPWNSAVRRAQLPELATTPAFGYDREYQLPADWLRTLWIEGRPEHRVEGRKILSDASAPLNLIYIAFVENMTQLDDHVKSVVAARLAFELVEAITGSSSKRNEIFTIWQERLSSARFIDSTEDSVKRLLAEEYIRAFDSEGGAYFLDLGIDV